MRAHRAPVAVRESLADVLKSYLGEAGRKPFVWGELDCFLFAADWIERVTGIDSAGEYRGAYATVREARTLIRRNGGALHFSDALMTRAGCIATQAPELGDVALVRAAFARRGDKIIFVPVGAIFLRDKMWAMKSGGAGSLTMGDFSVIRAWALPRG